MVLEWWGGKDKKLFLRATQIVEKRLGKGLYEKKNPEVFVTPGFFFRLEIITRSS